MSLSLREIPNHLLRYFVLQEGGTCKPAPKGYPPVYTSTEPLNFVESSSSLLATRSYARLIFFYTSVDMEGNPQDSLEGTYNDPANTFIPKINARLIPAFLFEDGDPSEGFFDYMNSPFKTLPTDTVANWTEACSSPQTIFTGHSSLGSFVGCLLYANITRNLASGSMVTNASDATFLSNASEQISSSLRSTYTTCLTSYCSSQKECATSDICDVGNLLTNNYELSSQGVTKCWLKLCTPNVQSANADIAGVGVRSSSPIPP